MPLAGPPPTADSLPSIPEEARRNAAVQMLLAVTVGLAAVIVLLHLMSKGRVTKPPEPTPEQELVERAQEALERMEEAGAQHAAPDEGEDDSRED